MVIIIVKANKYQLADSFQKTREMEQKIQVLTLFDKSKKIVKKLPQEIINTAPIRKYVDVLFLDVKNTMKKLM